MRLPGPKPKFEDLCEAAERLTTVARCAGSVQRIYFLQAAPKFGLGQLPFANPAVAYSIREGEQLVELEVFHGRGRDAFLRSHDIEDLIYLVDGHPEIIDESRLEPKNPRDYLHSELSTLLATPAFMDALPGHLFRDQASQLRLTTVIRRLKDLASL